MATADLHAVIHLVDSPEPGASRSRHLLRYPLDEDSLLSPFQNPPRSRSEWAAKESTTRLTFAGVDPERFRSLGRLTMSVIRQNIAIHPPAPNRRLHRSFLSAMWEGSRWPSVILTEPLRFVVREVLGQSAHRFPPYRTEPAGAGERADPRRRLLNGLSA
jgi:hypothetical protein